MQDARNAEVPHIVKKTIVYTFLFIYTIISFLKNFRLLKQFYEKEHCEITALAENGKVNKLSLLQTLPSFLFFAALGVPLLGTEHGRSLYWKTAVFGTAGCMIWMNFKS